MTEKEILLIKSSWKIFRQIEPTVLGDLFYGHLLHKNSSLASVFKYSLERQSLLLIDFLNTIIFRLEDLGSMQSKIKELAELYASYGITPKYYPYISDALMFTIEKGIGKDWNDEIKNAWINGNEEVNRLMTQALS
jgi:hemoglobin-like flavoprotein